MTKPNAALARVVDELRTQVDRLERRVATLEGKPANAAASLPEMLKAYPAGGLRGLASAIGVCLDTLYQFANARLAKFKPETAEAIVKAFARKKKTITAEQIREAWMQAKFGGNNV